MSYPSTGCLLQHQANKTESVEDIVKLGVGISREVVGESSSCIQRDHEL